MPARQRLACQEAIHKTGTRPTSTPSAEGQATNATTHSRMTQANSQANKAGQGQVRDRAVIGREG